MRLQVRAPGALDVEPLRCALEHEARAALDGLGTPRPRFAPTLADARRGLSEDAAVPLRADEAPELAVLAPLAAASLGLQHTRVELWRASEPRLARYVPVASPEERVAIVVMLDHAVLDELGTDAMLALLAHELGHHLAHGSETTYVPGEECAARSSAAFCANSARMACEITADRLALVGCRDLEAHLRLDLAHRTGPLGEVAARVRLLLAEAREVIAQLARERRPVALEDPLHERALRVWASAEFVESDRYRELTGLGSGRVALDALDRVIAEHVRGPTPLTKAAREPRRERAPERAWPAQAETAWLSTATASPCPGAKRRKPGKERGGSVPEARDRRATKHGAADLPHLGTGLRGAVLRTTATLHAVERDLEDADRALRALGAVAVENARPSVEALAQRTRRWLRRDD